MVESAAVLLLGFVGTGWRCGCITCLKVQGFLEPLHIEPAGENRHLEYLLCAVKALQMPVPPLALLLMDERGDAPPALSLGLSCFALRRLRSTATSFDALAFCASQWRLACRFRRLQVTLLPRKLVG